MVDYKQDKETTHGISVTRIIHTETQDGKSILDAYFACAMPILMEWLVKHNSEELGVLSSKVLSMEKQLRSVVGHAIEIEISFRENSKRLVYQRIGGGINAHCIPSQNTFFVDGYVELQGLDEEEVDDEYIGEADISDEHDSIVTTHNANAIDNGIGIDLESDVNE
ncbi:hypothetical protein PHMEG_00013179 [Phytophthora megakarya]|uniref:Uncharacterized protein n=1 Tax=Phytophthora megakarya TaxID=4795 RepID=A0A225W6X9_9STRA|nr:hypothetical protein PHMEG_00013179 [Phytophthora megakarya]